MRLTVRKTILALLLVILLIGAVFAFIQVQRQQELRGRAAIFHWASTQSASTACSSLGNIFVNVSFTNGEATRSMIVSVTDKQSGKSINLGTVKAHETITGSIDTGKASLVAGTVEFTLAWADNIDQKDTVSASYKALDSCPEKPYCTESTTSACSWDELPEAEEYNVTVIDTTGGEIVATQTVTAPATRLEFSSEAGKTYQCTVTAVNACGSGTPTKSKPMTCVVPPSTPTPTLPVCQENVSKCSWDGLDGIQSYNVKVTNTNTGEVVKSGSVNAPATQFDFPSEQDVSYQCEVTAVNSCGPGKGQKSPPKICSAPTPTLTPTVPVPTVTIPVTPTRTPTPTVTGTPIPVPSKYVTPTRVPTLTPVPTYTPAPTMTPYPTYTPAPTPTPYPTATPQPTATPYPTFTPIPTPTAVTQTQQKTYPTLAPTGDADITYVMAGIGLVIAIVGGIIFFAL